MEIKTKNKEIFDTEQNWKNLKIDIKANTESSKYNGIWIINDITEDFLMLLNLITRKEVKMTVRDFNLLMEKYADGYKENRITCEKFA